MTSPVTSPAPGALRAREPVVDAEETQLQTLENAIDAAIPPVARAAGDLAEQTAQCMGCSKKTAMIVGIILSLLIAVASIVGTYLTKYG